MTLWNIIFKKANIPENFKNYYRIKLSSKCFSASVHFVVGEISVIRLCLVQVEHFVVKTTRAFNK